MKNGQPKPEFTGGIGVLSIVKTAENFGGEYDFKNDDGVFVFRLIMNIPSSDDNPAKGREADNVSDSTLR